MSGPQLTQDCIVLVTLLVLGLSSSHVTVCLQENNVPLVSTPQYWSGNHNIIFVDELRVHFCLHASLSAFRETLLECDDKVVNMHNMSFSYCGEMEVYWEPQVVPKQKIMQAIARDSRPHPIVSLN